VSFITVYLGIDDLINKKYSDIILNNSVYQSIFGIIIGIFGIISLLIYIKNKNQGRIFYIIFLILLLGFQCFSSFNRYKIQLYIYKNNLNEYINFLNYFYKYLIIELIIFISLFFLLYLFCFNKYFIKNLIVKK
jgi:hypothetical protein